MFPNYRTSAADRRRKLATIAIVALILLAGCCYLAAVYVVAHFVAKFW